MIRRTAAALATLLVAAGLLSGCVGEPAPTESTPLFATEDEAFAAAEQTYRNYVDALNQVDLSDPATFEAVYAWTTGDANAADRRSFTEMHAQKLTVQGLTRAPLVESSSMAPTRDAATLSVCLDVSDVTLTDPSGISTVDPQREDVQSLTVSLASARQSSTGWLISVFAARTGPPRCPA